MRRSALLALSFVAGCYTAGPGPIGYEDACADGRDNDQDGRVDCMDTDCIMRGHCGEQIPVNPVPGPENTFELCSDGIDNDDDGTFDCGDRVCQSIMELCCVTEIDDTSCSDRIDNDGNGFADCGDFSCRNNRFVTVCESETVCDDTFDDDGDRLADCADDDCAASPACRTPCTDTGPENTAALCTDDCDNDGNGFADCDDFDCSMNPDPAISGLCTASAEDTLARCSDGIDNDENGFPDCADFSCFDTRTDPPSGPGATYCADRVETTVQRCSDGVDNDANGFTDCLDFSCSRSDDDAVLEYCERFTETTIAACTDGIDNDGNGFADCADFSCDFRLLAWGIETCTSDADCEGGRCEDDFCYRDCTGPGDCPAGTECDGGRCEQTCAETSECDPGESCYRGRCLGIISPCVESGYIDASSNVQCDGACVTPTDSTLPEQIAMSRAQCTDGIDNDGDGFTDCEDWECNYNPRALGADGEPLCQSAGGRTCVLGARAGEGCASDAECGGIAGACVLTGIAGRTLVCP
jgi:hypothetical protein